MSSTPENCIHLTVEIVKEIHDAVLSAFGGATGIPDEGLLHSAVGAPQSTLGRQSPFGDLVEVAAAYLSEPSLHRRQQADCYDRSYRLSAPK